MRRLLVRSVLVVAGSAGLFATTTRIHVWGDETRLWTAAVAQAPMKPRPLINLGNQYVRQGRVAEGQHAYEVALLLSMDARRPLAEQVFGLGIASVNLARLRAARQDWAGAARLLRMAGARRPTATVVRETEQWVFEQAGPSVASWF